MVSHTLLHVFLTGPFLTAISQFEVGNSSAIVLDPVSEAAAFFARFDQPEVNDLDPSNFCGFKPPYVDFHGFKVPEDCASQLEAVNSVGNMHVMCAAKKLNGSTSLENDNMCYVSFRI